MEERGPATCRILVGTCNWADHTDFYPLKLRPAERLAYYAQHFPIVEVDSTFYHLMPARNFFLWADRTPPGFVFDVKAYRELTLHERSVQPADETFERFSASLQPLREAAKLRAVLFQFPPWFTFSLANIAYLDRCCGHFPEETLAVEFRHRSWLDEEHQEETLVALRERGLAFVMVDEPQLGSGSVPPVVAVTSPKLAIVRFHGRNRRTWYKRTATSGERFDYLYSREELAEWLPRIAQAAPQARELHLLMNNNARNYAVVNAQDMMSLLGPRAEPPPQGRLALPQA